MLVSLRVRVLRNGISGSFLDFDLIPLLLARAEATSGRGETDAAWSGYLDEVGFEDAHLDPDEFPSGMSAADCMDADAWRFAERMGFIESSGPTSDGRKVAPSLKRSPIAGAKPSCHCSTPGWSCVCAARARLVPTRARSQVTA